SCSVTTSDTHSPAFRHTSSSEHYVAMCEKTRLSAYYTRQSNWPITPSVYLIYFICGVGPWRLAVPRSKRGWNHPNGRSYGVFLSGVPPFTIATPGGTLKWKSASLNGGSSSQFVK